MSYALLQARKQLLKAAALAIFAPVVAACGGLSPFAPSTQAPPISETASRADPAQSSAWKFTTLDNPDDPDYNELLGINNLGKICGFHGKGAASKPKRGYCVQDYGNSEYRNENYPGAVDTIVTSLNSTKQIAGYYVTRQGWIFGFTYNNGIWTSYKDPQTRSSSNVTELLGINESGLAVGFYTDQSGVNHGFELDETTGKFHGISPPGGVSVTATAINGKGDIVGYMTTSKGTTESFLLKGGSYTVFSYPHETNTQALGLNWQDQIVGSYQEGSVTHGFVLSDPLTSQQWQSVDEPKAHGYTVLTCIQNHEYIVGYYIDSSKHYNGFLASPLGNG
jgi:probable HAF family extracellular repeat protein